MRCATRPDKNDRRAVVVDPRRVTHGGFPGDQFHRPAAGDGGLGTGRLAATGGGREADDPRADG